ncbi:MAG: CpsD/CapB family tyrosine-protein kinase [Sedimentibacter sp.]|uniref:CpsD/CapB family tyrosine-protein kinase n=1 Tax=Sedimentibacter sp. TaxID=1960295 RepID=UPI0031582103
MSMQNMVKYMVKDHPDSSITESYRKAATNIEFANIDDNIKVVMLTSSIAGEGKTTTICNIAAVMTEFNKNVLLLDLDLRKPSIHKFYNLSNKIGLTDLLINKDDYKKYINNVYPRLDVITAGKIPSNAAEIINSKAIKDLMNDLTSHYDYIFLDTPPIAMVSDPITVATYADAIILAIAYGETEIEVAKKSVASLRQVNGNIIGTILTKTPVAKFKRHYY